MQNHGDNTVEYAVTANASPLARSGTLLIPDEIFTITQAGGSASTTNIP